MEQSEVIETFENSLMINIWVERNNAVVILLTGIISIYLHFSLIQFLELLLGGLSFTGVVLLGFVGFAAHLQYYFRFERNRKVELYADRIIISINGNVLEEIVRKDILQIVSYDRLKNKIDNELRYNAWPTYLDPFYYLIIIENNQERVILTCLLDIKLKEKIAAWYGQQIEHKYQFFPFPSIN